MLYADNYAWHDWRKDGFAEDGDVFEGANLSQAVPGMPIGLRRDGTPAKGLLFRRCNLLNCLPPEDARVEDCLTAQVEFCSRLHPEVVQHGLTECPEDCPHVQPGGEVWQPVSEAKFRELARDVGRPENDALRIVKDQDVLGVVTEQRFLALAPLHEDRVLPKWRPAKALTGNGELGTGEMP